MKRILNALTNLSSKKKTVGRKPTRNAPRQRPDYTKDTFGVSGSGVHFGRGDNAERNFPGITSNRNKNS